MQVVGYFPYLLHGDITGEYPVQLVGELSFIYRLFDIEMSYHTTGMYPSIRSSCPRHGDLLTQQGT